MGIVESSTRSPVEISKDKESSLSLLLLLYNNKKKAQHQGLNF
jgi:hypothetical protein